MNKLSPVSPPISATLLSKGKHTIGHETNLCRALQAGVLVVHRLDAKDAEEIAAQFGTKSTWKVTHQMDWETGSTSKGSVRDVEDYVVHPNTLRRLPVGQAAVRSVPTDRTAIVEVIKTD